MRHHTMGCLTVHSPVPRCIEDQPDPPRLAHRDQHTRFGPLRGGGYPKYEDAFPLYHRERVLQRTERPIWVRHVRHLDDGRRHDDPSADRPWGERLRSCDERYAGRRCRGVDIDLHAGRKGSKSVRRSEATRACRPVAYSCAAVLGRAVTRIAAVDYATPGARQLPLRCSAYAGVRLGNAASSMSDCLG